QPGVSTGPIAKVDVTSKGIAGLDPAVKTGVLAQRSIFYDLDSYEVKDQYKPLVEAHARYLRDNPGRKTLIQGNTDERGSREYNIGLGQRRSDGVKRMLLLLSARKDPGPKARVKRPGRRTGAATFSTRASSDAACGLRRGPRGGVHAACGVLH